jgi:hypothetical protein
MSLEKDYTKITERVNLLIKDRKYNGEAGDVISGGYLLFVESGYPYSFTTFIVFCKKHLFDSLMTFTDVGVNGEGKRTLYRYSQGDYKTCARCKELFPIAEYYDCQKKDKQGIIVKSSYCRNCLKIRGAAHRAANIEAYRKRDRDRKKVKYHLLKKHPFHYKKYRLKERERIRKWYKSPEIKKKYYDKIKKQCKELSDVYIRKQIRKTIGSGQSVSEKMIKEKRNQILIFRAKRQKTLG